MQMQLMNIHKDGFLQNGRHNSYQSYRYDSFTCAQPTAELLEQYARLTSSLLVAIPTWWDWSGSQDTWIGNVEQKYTTNEDKQKTIETFRIACCIVDVHFWGVTVKQGSTVKLDKPQNSELKS